MTDPIRVLLVEDDPALRESLAGLLEICGHAVTAVGDGLSFYRHLAEGSFAVAVIDLNLPDQNGEVLVEYTRRNTHCPVVVVTARDTLETRVDCYRCGADLFLGKPVNGRELAAAITSLAGRHRQLAGAVPATRPECGHWRLLARQRALMFPDGGVIPLSPREYCLLEQLALADGAPVRRGAILEALYRRDDESAQRALDTLVRRTRKKLAERYAGPSPILTHHGLGYMLGVPLVRG